MRTPRDILMENIGESGPSFLPFALPLAGSAVGRGHLRRAGVCLAALASLEMGLAIPSAHADVPDKRIALLIQNDLYPDAEPAKVADEDAATLAAVLKRDGFEVEVRTNATKREMRASIDAFLARITPKSVALVYFKGIGVQASRLTYLLPVDSSIWSEADVRKEGTGLDHLIADLDKRGASVKIAIVDAARRNPFERRFRMYSAGLAPPLSPEGSLVLFAEALDKVAEPATAQVSPFMTELSQHLTTAHDAEDAFTRTRNGVSKLSRGHELPWVSSTLVDPFVLTAEHGASAPPHGAQPSSGELGKVPTPSAPPPPPTSPLPSGAASAGGEPAQGAKPGKPSIPSAAADPAGKPPTPPAPKPSPAPSPPASTTSAAPAGKPEDEASPGTPPASQAPQVSSPPSIAAEKIPETHAPPGQPTTASQPAPGPEKPTLLPGSTFSDCKRCPEMTVLAAASFRMGSGTTPFDRPVHEVTLRKPFAIALSVVTRGEWAACVEDGGCTFHADGKGTADAERPAVDVTWSDAGQYAGWLSRKTGKTYRLPTEAEWEYAARGGARTAFAWGDAAGVGHANCTDCGSKTAHPEVGPVRTYPANGFGLFDMAGNVAQWLQDCWTSTYRDAPADGSAPPVANCRMRVLRGGSFATSSAYVKPTARSRAEADARSPSTGFRVVRDIE